MKNPKNNNDIFTQEQEKVNETMNIFFLHLDPKICAMMHFDKHVIKMILETTLMLCSVWHMFDPEHKMYTPCYKLTHKNHPSCIWTRESRANYIWLCKLGLELCKEYTYRYGKVHKCQSYIEELSANVPPLKEKEWTPPRLAMPDDYKGDDCVESYRQYVFFEKTHLHSWKGKIAGRDPPTWFVEFHKMFE